MKIFIVNSKDLENSLSPKKILENPEIPKRFLACIWCGGDIPKDKPFAMYCSKKCKKEALGQK